MSHCATGWAWQQDCGPVAKLVLLRLAWHANGQGECWPSYSRIAKDLQLSRRTVVSQIQALVKARLLVSERRSNGRGLASNCYHLPSAANAPPPVQEMHHPGAADALPPSAGDALEPLKEVSKKEEPPISPPLAKSSARASRRSATAPLIDSDFEAWWRIYPRHVGKKAALVKYRVARKTVEADPLLAAARLYAEKRLGEEAQFTAHPATWLSQGRWLDDEAQPPPERALEPLPANWRELINLPTEEEPNDIDQSTTPLPSHDRKTAA